MHHLNSLLLTFSLQVEISYQIATLIKSKHVLFFSLQFQLPSECTILSLISYFSLQFQIISNTIRMHNLPSLFSFYSLQFQIGLSTVTMHALETLLTSISLQFKIVSNTVRMYECTKAYM